MSEKMHNNKPVLEFGQAVAVTAVPGMQDAANQLLERNYEQFKDPLKYITDFEFIGDVEYVHSQPIDLLNRYTQSGWRATAASVGYGELQRHFACHKQHVPNEITLEFISQIVEMYARQQKYEEDDE